MTGTLECQPWSRSALVARCAISSGGRLRTNEGSGEGSASATSPLTAFGMRSRDVWRIGHTPGHPGPRGAPVVDGPWHDDTSRSCDALHKGPLPATWLPGHECCADRHQTYSAALHRVVPTPTNGLRLDVGRGGEAPGRGPAKQRTEFGKLTPPAHGWFSVLGH